MAWQLTTFTLSTQLALLANIWCVCVFVRVWPHIWNQGMIIRNKKRKTVNKFPFFMPFWMGHVPRRSNSMRIDFFSTHSYFQSDALEFTRISRAFSAVTPLRCGTPPLGTWWLWIATSLKRPQEYQMNHIHSNAEQANTCHLAASFPRNSCRHFVVLYIKLWKFYPLPVAMKPKIK